MSETLFETCAKIEVMYKWIVTFVQVQNFKYVTKGFCAKWDIPKLGGNFKVLEKV